MITKKSAKTNKKSVKKSSPKKNNRALTTAKKPVKKANPFNSAHCVIAGKDFKVQTVVATNSGLKIKEKTVNRNASTEKQFNSFKGKAYKV